MTQSDVDEVRDLLNGFLIINSKAHQFWSKQEIEHYFLSSVVQAYVVEEDGKITDFFSFYLLPTLILPKDDT